ncbi:MAG: hypothetical protein QM764_22025 [Chitinophagaceae bacterium]
MKAIFIFPDNSNFTVDLDCIPRHNEIVELMNVNSAEMFASQEAFSNFKKDHRSKNWRVNAVTYQLSLEDRTTATVHLIEKEDTASYSVS